MALGVHAVLTKGSVVSNNNSAVRPSREVQCVVISSEGCRVNVRRGEKKKEKEGERRKKEKEEEVEGLKRWNGWEEGVFIYWRSRPQMKSMKFTNEPPANRLQLTRGPDCSKTTTTAQIPLKEEGSAWDFCDLFFPFYFFHSSHVVPHRQAEFVIQLLRDSRMVKVLEQEFAEGNRKVC